MKGFIALAATLALLPVAAHARDGDKFSEQVGPWLVTGSGGDCMMGMVSGKQMLMVASPASKGENVGGIMITADGMNVVDGPTTLEFGPGAWAGPHRGSGHSDVPAYWAGFGSASDPAGFPDSWRMTVRREGVVLIDMPVTGYRAAKAALDRCVQQTR